MLYAFTNDRTGVGFYRVAWPLGEIRDRVPLRIVWPGDDVPLVADIDRTQNKNSYWVPSVKGVQIPDDCSAVMLQRPTSILLVQCLPYLKARDIKIIIEIDDNLHALSPRHATYKYLNPVANPLAAPPSESLDALLLACALADLIVCSTPALVDKYAPPGAGGAPGVVLRNRLRSDWRACLKKEISGERTAPSSVPPRVSPILGVLQVPELPLPVTRSEELEQELARVLTQPVDPLPPAIDNDPDELKIGWAGVITTHPDDLQVLARALPRTGISTFHILGPQPRELDEGGIVRARRLLGLSDVRFTGSVTFADYLPALSQALDIGLAPLEDNTFNRSKSWLKKLEMSACGIPHIAADTPEYKLLPTGLTASDSHKDWASKLRTLISSPALRDDLVAAAYDIADENTYSLHADEWYDAISPYVEGSN